MNWLVRFLTVDVPALSRGELGTVLFDMRQIAGLVLSDRSRSFAKWELMPDAPPMTTDTSVRNVWREARLRETLTHYQESLTRMIGDLSQHQRTVLPISSNFDSHSIPFEIIAGRTYPALAVHEGTINEVERAFKFRLVFVLQACADRLGVCARQSCSRVFLKAQRADQEYCSRGCGTAVRVQRKRLADKVARLANKAAKTTKTKRKRKPLKKGRTDHAKR
jgi:hypothetical protein